MHIKEHKNRHAKTTIIFILNRQITCYFCYKILRMTARLITRKENNIFNLLKLVICFIIYFIKTMWYISVSRGYVLQK